MSHTLDNVAAEDEVTSSMLLIRDEEEHAAEHARLRAEDPDLLHAIEQSNVLEIPQFPSSQADENDRVYFALQASLAEHEGSESQIYGALNSAYNALIASAPGYPYEITADVADGLSNALIATYHASFASSREVPDAAVANDPLPEGEVAVEALQEGRPLATPAEAAAAVELATQGAPPTVLGEVTGFISARMADEDMRSLARRVEQAFKTNYSHHFGWGYPWLDPNSRRQLHACFEYCLRRDEGDAERGERNALSFRRRVDQLTDMYLRHLPTLDTDEARINLAASLSCVNIATAMDSMVEWGLEYGPD